jgi:uncharacterized protein
MKIALVLSALILTPCALATTEEVNLITLKGTLYGTLELPSGNGPFALILIHPGSGPTDRDGNSAMGLKNDSLKMLAQGLSKEGFATLRIDKRGIAASAKAMTREEDLRFETYISDVVAWSQKMSADKRFNHLVLLGHSEGALITLLAAQKVKPAAYISVAGPAQNAADLLLEQLNANPANPPALLEESQKAIAELRAGRLVPKVSPVLMSLFRPSVQPYMISWFQYTPTQEIAKLECAVLVLQGTTDLQVGVKDADLLYAALENNEKNPNKTILKLDGMNHILKLAPLEQAANLATYNNPTLPLAPELLPKLSSWLKSVLKQIK